MSYKRTLFLLTLLVLFLILPWSNQITQHPTLLENTQPELKISNGVTVSINGNLALSAAASSGNGSVGNPYIIKDKIINASGAGTHGISISNTNAYFILRNCTVTNANSPHNAIYFYNVTHARLENITASENHAVAIELNSSVLITLVNTTANNNYLAGIWLWKCISIILTAIAVNKNSYGLVLAYSNYSSISGVIANNNGQVGIQFENSHTLSLIDATSNNNNYGIHFYICHHSTIYSSIANNNRFDGIYLALSNSDEVIGNHINNNSIGIELASSNNNKISGNTLYNNSECITETDCTGNTLKNNDCGNSGNPLLIVLLILIPIVGVALGLFILYRRRGLNKSL
jgi:parallel beta-helix repeat protein